MIKASVRLKHPPFKNRWIDESPINIWLLANVGHHSAFKNAVHIHRPWYVEHLSEELVYHFAREEDAMMFSLRWL